MSARRGPAATRWRTVTRTGAIVVGTAALGVGALGFAPAAAAASHGNPPAGYRTPPCPSPTYDQANYHPGYAASLAQSYVVQHYQHGTGSATVGKTELDTERAPSGQQVCVFDLNAHGSAGGTYSVHVTRTAQSSMAVWWAAPAESSGGGGGGGGGGGAPTGVTYTLSPQISAGQAANAAVQQVGASQVNTSRGNQGVKKQQLHAKDGKLYYQVKLYLDQHGTTNVWVDASTGQPVVTAVQGGGHSYRDSSIVSPTTADARAESFAHCSSGGCQVTQTALHGGKWRFYEVDLRTPQGNRKIWLSAATGTVIQAKSS